VATLCCDSWGSLVHGLRKTAQAFPVQGSRVEFQKCGLKMPWVPLGCAVEMVSTVSI
jgi:hypothetical protein